MSPVEAIILGIIQGITEFFPVSSSGHLKLMQYLFGWENLSQYILFDIICHLGTLLSIFIVLKKDIISLLTTERKDLISFIIALLPLLPLYLILKQIHTIYDQPKLLGYFFIITSILLFIGDRFSRKKPLPGYKTPFIIGCVQALAILPGISRSGSTIASAKLLGWSYEKAFRFSFLLAIPTIIGGTLVEVLRVLKDGAPIPVAISQYALGFSFSFLFGILALKILLKILQKKKIAIFVYYCLILGILTLIETHLR